jgi:hypothetical protein
MDPNIPTKGFFTNVRYMFDLRDVVVDVQGECMDHTRLRMRHMLNGARLRLALMLWLAWGT